ncbi:MAG: hypothetical protein MJ214_05210 [Bacilli bacterium]|nr:hypothetical protein [Bacilli bacterium]
MTDATGKKSLIIASTIGGAGVVAAVAMGIVLGLSPKVNANKGTVRLFETREDYESYKKGEDVKPIAFQKDINEYYQAMPKHTGWGFLHFFDATDNKTLEYTNFNDPLISNISYDHDLYCEWSTNSYRLDIVYASNSDKIIHTVKDQTVVDEGVPATIAQLKNLDDPSDKEHHTRMFDGIYSNKACTPESLIYGVEGEYNPVTLTEDTIWYVNLRASHYHIYLHYWNDFEGNHCYNPNDYYPTSEFEPTTVGFTQRGAPKDETNYEFLGWQLTTSNKPTAKTKEECLYGVNETPREDANGNMWPVVPDKMHIVKGDEPKATTWHLHPIYQLTNTTFYFFDADGGSKLFEPMTTKAKVETPREFKKPVKDHSDFLGWIYNEDAHVSISGQSVLRQKGTSFTDGDLSAEFLDPTVSLKASWKATQHQVTFYLDKNYTENESKSTWININEGVDKKTITVSNTDLPKEASIIEPSGLKFIGWSKEIQTSTKREDLAIQTFPETIEITESSPTLIYYPVFVEPDYEITVDLNGGKWEKADGTTEDAANVTIKVWNDINYDPASIMSEVKKAANKEDYTLIGSTASQPNFSGWRLNEESDIIRSTVKFTSSEDTLTAIYALEGNVTITFNSNAGDFTYTNLIDHEVITFPTLTYEFNLPEWVKIKKRQPTFEDIYKEATDAIEDVKDQTRLTRDGYRLNEDKSTNKPGWINSGISIFNTTPITDSTTFYADWTLKESSSWKDDDWGTIIHYANLGEDAFEVAYKEAYDSSSNVGDPDDTTSKNKATGTFVGLEKEISLPSLDDKTFTTRLIGYKQDTLSGGGGKALLTFDFVDCPIKASIGERNDYIEGTINKVYAGLLRGAMSYTLRNNIKSVVKYQLVDKGKDTKTDSYGVTTFNNTIFIESALEVNGGTAIPTSSREPSLGNHSACVEYTSNTESGGKFFTYDWYKKKYDDGSKAATEIADRQVSDTGNREIEGDTDCSYRHKYFGAAASSQIVSWQLRTPAIKAYYLPEQYTHGGTKCSFYVTSKEYDPESAEGKAGYGGIYDYYSSNANSISPCFCLGIE